MSYEKTCVYTCLMGDYETLNELTSVADSKIPRFCFTDNPSLKSETWTIRLIEPAFPMDSVRSQRRVKILAHEYLPEFEASLYVDNTVGLKVAPEAVLEKYFDDADIAVPGHSFRESVFDEFVAVAKDGLDEPSRIFEQLNHYQVWCPETLNQRPYWTAILMRHHHRSPVREVMVGWYNQVMRYSRRDQLSFNAALVESNAKVRIIEVDNGVSWFHDWPLQLGRDTSKRLTSFAMSGASCAAQLRSTQLDLGQANSGLASSAQEIANLNARLFELSQHANSMRGLSEQSQAEAARMQAQITRTREEMLRMQVEAARDQAVSDATRVMEAEQLQAQVAAAAEQLKDEFDLRRRSESELAAMRASLEAERQERVAMEATIAWRVSRKANTYFARHPTMKRVVGVGARGVYRTAVLVGRAGSARAGDRASEIGVIAGSALFDANWYRQSYPDVAAAGLDCAEHYLIHGAKDGRDPSPAFDTAWYLESNPDVAATGMNPLLHYETSGKTEGRQVKRAVSGASGLLSTSTTGKPSVSDIVYGKFPALRPMPIFRVPADQTRITLVTDSINAGSLFGGVGTALVFGASLAQHLGAKLRIVTRTQKPEAKNFAAVLNIHKISWTENVEFVYVPYDRSVRLPTGDADIFLTTSWWTTESVRQVVAPERIVYLLQEDERMFYAAGDERLRCAEVMSDPALKIVVNSRLLYEHLTTGPEALPNVLARGAWFEPAFPSVFVKKKPGEGKRHFFFYARPNNLRNLYFRGLEVLRECLEEGILNGNEWEFHFAGRDLVDIELPGGVVPKLYQNIPWAEYVALVQNMDVGLSLMDTPHPSYPPLDLAASGAVVVTNTHGNKTSLDVYSKNIICAEPTVEALKKAIATAVSLSSDHAAYLSNLGEAAIGRDWGTSFAPVLRTMFESGREIKNV